MKHLTIVYTACVGARHVYDNVCLTCLHCIMLKGIKPIPNHAPGKSTLLCTFHDITWGSIIGSLPARTACPDYVDRYEARRKEY